MAEIVVNSEYLRTSAGRFLDIKVNIEAKLNDIKVKMEGLKGSFEGEAAESIFNQFGQLSDDFEERGTTIQQYAEYLNTIAEEWTAKENEIKAEAQSKRVDV